MEKELIPQCSSDQVKSTGAASDSAARHDIGTLARYQSAPAALADLSKPGGGH
jgi:hypothetical protein